MSPRLPSSQVEELAAFQQRHRTQLLTLAFIGIEDSTGWRQRLGDFEAERLFVRHRDLVARMLQAHPDSLLIEPGDDSMLVVFSRPSEAVDFALRLHDSADPVLLSDGEPIPVRIGIHVGEVLVERGSGPNAARRLNGLEVDRCRTLMRLAASGRILLTRQAHDMARAAWRGRVSPGVPGIRWIEHGFYAVRGLPDPIEICEASRSGPTPPRLLVDGTVARRLPAGRRGAIAPMSRWQLLMGATLIALITAIGFRAGGPWVTTSYDFAYLMKRSEPPPSDAVLVLMDVESHQAEGQDPNGRWDRALHARLLDRLTDYGARAVVLDLIFSEPDRERPESDSRLVDAVRRNGRVMVATNVRTSSNLRLRQRGLVHPFDDLRDVLSGYGPVQPMINGPAGKKARMQFGEVEGYPSLPHACLIAMGDVRSVPREGWLYHYASHASHHSIERHSYTSVLRDTFDPNPFAGRVVFVGFDARGFDARGFQNLTNSDKRDLWYTPYTHRLLGNAREAPGVEIVATAFLNLKHGDILVRLPPFIECAILTITATLAVWGAGRVGLLSGLGWATLLALGIAWIGTASVWWTHVWFPWLIGVAQLPMALGWSALVRIDGALAVTRQHRSRESAPPGPVQPEGLPRVPVAPGPPADSPPQSSGSLVPKDSEHRTPLSPTGRPVIPDFEALREIARGSFGEVWLCRSAIGEYRAVKVVWRRSFSSERPFEQEFNGIRSYAPISFSHPSLLPIFHVGRRDALGYLFYVMELADDLKRGRAVDPEDYRHHTLAFDLSERRPLPLGECMDLVENLANGLDVLHGHGLVHRDIKPANIVFVNGVPKLADIGLVAVVDPDRSRSFVGTEGYLAPEGPGRPTADIFSLGMVLYTAAMGMDASAFPELPDWMPDHPDRPAYFLLNDIVLKACELDAQRRFPKAEAFADALRALRRGLSTISMDGLTDALGLVNRLRQPQDALCEWLIQRLGEDVRHELDAWPPSGTVAPERIRALLLALNSLIAGRSLYESSRFEGRSLRRQTRYLADLNPTGWDLARLNKLLLEDAFPGHFRNVPLMPEHDASFASPPETPSTGSRSG